MLCFGTQGWPRRQCAAWVWDAYGCLVLMGQLCHTHDVSRGELDVMVDLHPDILAGIEDWTRDLKPAEVMLAPAARNGTSTGDPAGTTGTPAASAATRAATLSR